MKTIFIAFANNKMAYSLKRIYRQAKRIGVFDEVITYTPDNLPKYVLQSPLFSCSRGAGYWCWKPAIIHEALQKSNEGDIVVYVDAGCTLRKSPEWAKYFKYMEDCDTICFQYSDKQPQWKKWGADSSRMKYWTKKATLDYLIDLYSNPDIGDLPQIWGGCLMMKGKDNHLLKIWKDLVFSHPELVQDPTPIETEDQYPEFSGHRHDQSLLTPLAIFDSNTLVLPEISEQYNRHSFVWASRCRAANFREYLAWKIKTDVRHLIGDSVFEKIKDRF